MITTIIATTYGINLSNIFIKLFIIIILYYNNFIFISLQKIRILLFSNYSLFIFY